MFTWFTAMSWPWIESSPALTPVVSVIIRALR